MKRTIFILAVVSFSLNACEDILNRTPLDQISDAVVWNDPGLIEAYLYQAYASVPFHFSQELDKVMDREIVEHITVCDEGVSKKTQDKGAAIWKKNLLDESGSKLFRYWGYNHIRRQNEFLKLIEDSGLEEKEMYKAEMRFIRAYTYFELVKRYGGVPLITSVQDVHAPLEELYVPRNSEKEIYDFVYQECSEIIELLPEQHPGGFGRATKYAAAALNSRAMMYAASIAQWGTPQLDGLLGFPPSDAVDYWQKSYDASRIIVGEDLSGTYHALYRSNPDPMLNFQEIFTEEKNIEIIFAKQYAGKDILGHRWDAHNVPMNRTPDDGQDAVIFGEEKQATTASVYLEFAEEFEYKDGSPGTIFGTRDAAAIAANTYTIEQLFGNKEPRFHASLFYHNAAWRGAILDWKKWDVLDGVKKPAKNRPIAQYEEVTGFGVRKYVDPYADYPQGASSDSDYSVFRFGEILLNYAEAAYELGKHGEALQAINELRNRVELPPHNTIDREKIRHERKVELAFEGNRFWDLRRWRTLLDEINPEKPFYGIEYAQIDHTDQYKIYLIGGDQPGRWVCNMSEKYYYLPLSHSIIGNNPMLAPENPGY